MKMKITCNEVDQYVIVLIKRLIYLIKLIFIYIFVGKETFKSLKCQGQKKQCNRIALQKKG